MLIEHGSTVLNLNDMSRDWTYRIAHNSWAPRVARRSRSLLADWPYDTTVEDYALMVQGQTPEACMDALAALVLAFDNARKFEQGLSSTPVIWKVRPEGARQMLSSMILPDPEDPENVSFDTSFLKGAAGKFQKVVPIQFRRRPLLVRAAEETSTISTAGMGTVQTVTWADSADTVSPVRVQLNAATNGGVMPDVRAGVVLISNTAADIQIHEGESFTIGAPWTSQADVANYASGGSVLRYTPVVTTRVEVLKSGISIPAGTWVPVLLCRNNTAGRAYLADIGMRYLQRTVYTGVGLIDLAVTTPTHVILPSVTITDTATSLYIGIQAISTGGTLDIDAVAFLNVANPEACLIVHGASVTALPGTRVDLRIDPQYLTGREPTALAYYGPSTAAAFSTIDGDISIALSGASATALWLPLDTLNAWTLDDRPTAVEFTAYRQRASLIPR
jgi:hypothetical protein